jgi:hypothetical protein
MVIQGPHDGDTGSTTCVQANMYNSNTLRVGRLGISTKVPVHKYEPNPEIRNDREGGGERSAAYCQPSLRAWKWPEVVSLTIPSKHIWHC